MHHDALTHDVSCLQSDREAKACQQSMEEAMQRRARCFERFDP